MSDENTELQEDTPTGYTEEDFKKVLSKKDQILKEKKQLQAKLEEIESEKAERDRLLMEEQGKHKELLADTTERYNKLKEQHNETLAEIRREKLQSANYAIASQLTKDTRKAKLLEKEVNSYAVYEAGQVRYEIDGLEVDKAKLLEHLSGEFDFLVDGSGASGAGATGSSRGGAVTKSFDKMNGAELTALRRSNPTEYNRIRDQYYNQTN